MNVGRSNTDNEGVGFDHLFCLRDASLRIGESLARDSGLQVSVDGARQLTGLAGTHDRHRRVESTSYPPARA